MLIDIDYGLFYNEIGGKHGSSCQKVGLTWKNRENIMSDILSGTSRTMKRRGTLKYPVIDTEVRMFPQWMLEERIPVTLSFHMQNSSMVLSKLGFMRFISSNGWI